MRGMLVYLDHWKKSVDKHRGPFSSADRKQMMLSEVTQNWMKITSKFIISMVANKVVSFCPFVQLTHSWN